MPKVSVRSSKAADLWVAALSETYPITVQDGRRIGRLAEIAFETYLKDWPGHSASAWKWPFLALGEMKNGAGLDAFRGDEPWTVLLRHGVVIARGCRLIYEDVDAMEGVQ